MDILLNLFIAIIPVFILLFYFWHRDRGEKEPIHLMRKVFLYGILIVIPIGLIEYFLDPIFVEFFGGTSVAYCVFMSFIIVALPEEYGKFLVVKKVVYNHSKFNEIMDGISYCILASMGFAVFENIMYTLSSGTGIGILRAFTAVPAHALFSGLMGYYMGLAKFEKDPLKEKKLLRRALMTGVFFHGLYDFFIFSGMPYLLLMLIPLLCYMGAMLHHAIRLANAGHKDGLKFF